MGLPFLKTANFSTIVKWHFHRLKSLLLRKQHREITKPRSTLLQRSRLERYLEFWTRITSNMYGNFGVWTFHTRFQAYMESAMRLHCPSNLLSFMDITHVSRLSSYRCIAEKTPYIIMISGAPRARFLRRLVLHDYIFCLANYTGILSRALLVALAKSTYYNYSLLSRIL